MPPSNVEVVTPNSRPLQVPNESDRDLLIALIKDVAEVKTEVRAYRSLEKDVRDLQKKMWLFMGFSGAIGGSIVSIIQSVVGN